MGQTDAIGYASSSHIRLHRSAPLGYPFSESLLERKKFPILGRPSPLCQVKDRRLGEPENSGGIQVVEASKSVGFCFLPH